MIDMAVPLTVAYWTVTGNGLGAGSVTVKTAGVVPLFGRTTGAAGPAIPRTGRAGSGTASGVPVLPLDTGTNRISWAVEGGSGSPVIL